MSPSNNTPTKILSAINETHRKITNHVQPAIESHVTNEEFNAKKDGLDFLEVKNSLMASYLIDLTYLSRLQLFQQNSPQPQDVPTIETNIQKSLNRLHEMRSVLLRIRPMEQKLRYHIDKLLVMGESSAFAERLKDSSEEKENPLNYRPNVEAMSEKKELENEKSEKDENGSYTSESADTVEDDEELKAAKLAVSWKTKEHDATQNSKDTPNIYKPPRLESMPFPEQDKGQYQQERQRNRKMQQMRNSEVLQTIQSQYGEKPEEEDIGGMPKLQKMNQQNWQEKQAQQTQFEEERMVRMTPSRKDKKMRNKLMREEKTNLNDIANLDTITAGLMEDESDSEQEEESYKRNHQNQKGRYSSGKRHDRENQEERDSSWKRHDRENQKERYNSGKRHRRRSDHDY